MRESESVRLKNETGKARVEEEREEEEEAMREHIVTNRL